MAKFSVPHKLNLAQLPTPIQHFPRLSKLASKHRNVNLFVKRDDLTHGPAMGNKIRKLEYLLSEAKSKGAKVVFTCGGIQSNHARATAILSKQLGLECVLFLRGEIDFKQQFDGNLLVDLLCGAKMRLVTEEQYEQMGKVFSEAAEDYIARDNKPPFFIPEGGSDALGAMGYLNAFNEIQDQAGNSSDLPDHFDSIVVANGSGGTHAGLLLGSMLSDWESKCKVFSFNVCRTGEEMKNRVVQLMINAVQRHRIPISVMPEDVQVIDGYVGPGYAKATPELYDFIVDVAKNDGLLLDPVYTGKALNGLLKELESGKSFGENILFIHTGGFPSIFAHSKEMSEALMRPEK